MRAGISTRRNSSSGAAISASEFPPALAKTLLLCADCTDARSLTEADPIDGARRIRIDELAVKEPPIAN